MLNFPVPYPDELVYSVIARAGVHLGLTSPKQLLDYVFEDRSVIATADLPSHLQQIASNFPEVLGYNAECLAYKHTLFPLYAPFTIETRRRRCLDWMASNSRKAIHMMLGLVASRIKQPQMIRYCPVCMGSILERYGELYWSRRWQITGAACCLEHGSLSDSELRRHSRHRHQFVAASPDVCIGAFQSQPSLEAQRVTRQVNMLLDRDPLPSANYEQWSAYYKYLVNLAGCNRGQQIDYDAVKSKVSNRWSPKWLQEHGLMVSDNQSCWLRSIFRKHRKSFSYLEHIVALDSLLPEDWSMSKVLEDVTKYSDNIEQAKAHKTYGVESEQELAVQRGKWLELVQISGTKEARHNGGGAVYAWLYRHDKAWLLATNKTYRLMLGKRVERVDWHARDIAVARKLLLIKKQYKGIDSPRKSRSWYLKKTGIMSTIEKKREKFPVTNLFIQRYSESVADYQIRRIQRVVSTLRSEEGAVPRWKVLRMSGLSESRLTGQAKRFLNQELDR